VDRHHRIIPNTHTLFPSSRSHKPLPSFHRSMQFVCFLTLWWNGGARGQKAHHQHSAAPLTAFQKEFVRYSSSGSRSIARGWEGMILPGRENWCYCVDQGCVGQSKWGWKMRKMKFVIGCILRWNDTRWHGMMYKMQDVMQAIHPEVSLINTPLHSLNLRYPCIPVYLCWPVHPHHPWISVHLP